MKILKISLISLFLTIFPISAIENIIFELDEIIFNLDPSPALRKFGLSFLGEGLTEKYQKRLIELIDKEEKTQNSHEITEKAIYRKCKLPYIWCAYLMNKIHGKDALKNIKQIIENNAWFTEKAILKHAADLSFDPQKEVELLKPNKELLKLLSHLKKSGINLYILTNKNKATIEALVKKHPEITKYFNNIICSGQSGHIKPHADAFAFLIKTHQLDPEKTLIIEREKECYRRAKDLGFNAILFKNYENLIKKLQNQNVITAPL